MYAIVDIETTGGYADRNRIVEIAIIIHNGKEVVGEYETLINPERNIPANISAIHGITNAMVQNAPRFFEVAKKIHELLDGNIFVAHNVNFDYGFIKHEFEMLGGKLNLKKLCTVRLCRKIMAGLPSYSLGNLCQQLKISIENRHRAAGDARATAILFSMLLAKDGEDFISRSLKKNSCEALLPANLPREQFEQLPARAGVYYFHDEKHQVIYLGKAKNIKSRVASHFTGAATSWSRQNFKSKIYAISYELTGSELIALLYESHEIKRLWPLYNRAQKYTAPNYGIFQYEDKNGYLRLAVNRAKPGDDRILTFKSLMDTRHYLEKKVKEYGLCPKLCGLQKAPQACFDYQIKLCEGACIGLVPTKDYNRILEGAVATFCTETASYAILGQGKDFGSKSVAVVENGRYLGFGYLPANATLSSLDDAKLYIKFYKDNQEIQRLISGYLKKSKDQVIRFNLQEESFF